MTPRSPFHSKKIIKAESEVSAFIPPPFPFLIRDLSKVYWKVLLEEKKKKKTGIRCSRCRFL